MEVPSCFVVDADPVSRMMLQRFINETNWLRYRGSYDNVQTAREAFMEQPADLIFVDVQVNGQSGAEFVQRLNPRALVIFMSSTRDFGSQAFAFHAVDYLLKPLARERFFAAAEKARWLYEYDTRRLKDQFSPSLMVKDHKALVKLNIADVVFVEAMGDYLKIYTSQKFYIMQGTMKDIDEKLQPHGFLRVHRSYLVALHRMNRLESGNLLVGNHKIPVSANHRPALTSAFKQNGI